MGIGSIVDYFIFIKEDLIMAHEKVYNFDEYETVKQPSVIKFIKRKSTK